MENAAPSRTRPPHPSPKPKSGNRALLFVSLAVNLALLVFLAVVWPKTEPAKNPPNEQAVVRSDLQSRQVHNHAHRPWDALESRDLAVYAANLRASGCPEKTVRDILLPLIEEKFANIELPDGEPTNFWASFSERQAAAAARTEQETAIRRERDKTVTELLGFAWDSAELNRVYTGDAAGSIGFLDYDRAEKFLCIADRFGRQFEDANKAHRVARREAIYEKWRVEAGAILSAADFEETELRGLLLLFQRYNANVCKAGLSGSELRQLMIARRELCKPLPSALLAGSDEVVQEPDSAGEQQFLSKTRAILGDDRFLDFLKSYDFSIERTITGLNQFDVDDSKFQRRTALQLFDLRQQSMARAQQIRDLHIPRAEKRVQLAALRQSALQQLLTVAHGVEESPIVRANEMWLQEIKSP